MDAQQRVTTFVAEHDLAAPPAYRAHDLTSEVGEVAKAVCTSTGYGAEPGAVDVPETELGDALFALLALAAALDVDADAALEAALEKYERRLAAGEDPGSGGRDEPAGGGGPAGR